MHPNGTAKKGNRNRNNSRAAISRIVLQIPGFLEDRFKREKLNKHPE